MPDAKPPCNHPMDAIADQFKPPQTAPQGPESVSIEIAGELDPLRTPAPQQKVIADADPLSLSLACIAAPAFFIDPQLNFCWMAPNGSDPFSLALKSAARSTDTRHIFKLLASRPLQESIADWQSMFSFIYTVLRRGMVEGGFAEGADPHAEMDRTDDAEDVSDSRETLPFSMESCQLDGGTEETPWRVYGLGFEQGTLFLLRQDPWQRQVASTQRENPADPAPLATRRTTCVLVARLNDSHRISDAMLPDGFLGWMNRVWDASDDVARRFTGVRSGNSGSSIYYAFKAVEATTAIFNAICCATRLNQRMQDLEKRLLAQGEWAGEIRLDIGINHGEDLSQDGNSTDDLPHMIPGGAFDQASHLAGIASAGEIWISKRTAAQLSASHIRQVVLGIEHQGQFLRNRFIRLTDLPQCRHSGHPAPEAGILSAARIIEVETPGADQPVSSEVQA